MNYVFGPVPSRRLGQSLGIDTIPLKTCNWNCVYCQLGHTTPLTNIRSEYIPRDDILVEVRHALKIHQPDHIDWITFVGSGEPTLHNGIGWLIREVKELTDIPVAVITNGALLDLPEVQEDLLPADVVLPSLDAGTSDLYRQINRPHPEITYQRLLAGLIAFRKVYQGMLWVEVMLVRGLNDTEETLKDIAIALEKIQPDEVHIVQPNRPPVETWVKPPTETGLLRAYAILGDESKIINPATGFFDLGGADSLVAAVIGIITRHPMREDELIDTLVQWSPGEVKKTLVELEEGDKAQVVERFGTRFWSAAPSRYPEKKRSERTDPKSRSRHQKKKKNQRNN